MALFFVLSGFLLSHQYLASADRRAAPTTRPRATTGSDSCGSTRRTSSESCSPWCSSAATTAPGSRDWVKVLTMGDIYVSDSLRPGQTQMWSLATEVSFYAAAAAAHVAVGALGGRRPTTRRMLVLFAALVAINVVWTLVLNEPVRDAGAVLASQWLPNYLMWFTAGMALAWAHVLVSQARRRGPVAVAGGAGTPARCLLGPGAQPAGRRRHAGQRPDDLRPLHAGREPHPQVLYAVGRRAARPDRRLRRPALRLRAGDVAPVGPPTRAHLLRHLLPAPRGAALRLLGDALRRSSRATTCSRCWD